MDKTAKVLVSRLKKHKTYKKYVKGHKTYMAHDPKNACQIGDKVRIIESRPVSRMKRWHVIELLDRGVKDVVDQVIDGRSEPGNDSDSNEVESG
jgi:small subunit ribosomal protein S17